MVDFDTAAAAVQDPNADPVFLAKIAYENPEFGANVVANPRAYPGLKRWVAQFGDERARQQLVAMGWPVPQEGVMQRNTETAPERAQQFQMQSQYQQPQQSSEVQYQMQYQPPATDQYQPESFIEAPASNMANDISTEYVDPYTNPAELAMTTQDIKSRARLRSCAPSSHAIRISTRICLTGLPVSMIPPSTRPSACASSK